MAITAETRQDIMELAVAANNAAPGTVLLSDLVAQSEAGSSLLDIANTLANSASFKATYPTFQTAEEFATEYLGNLVPEASAAAQAEGVTIIIGMLNAGQSRGAVILEAATYLAALSTSDASFGTSASLFNNRVAVATYHTITSEAAASWDIPASVTSAAGSVDTGKSAVDSALSASDSAQTLTLTTGINVMSGGGAADTFDASKANSLSAGDVLDGGAGTDTLTAVVNASLAQVNSTDIEVFNITAATAASTLNFADTSGVTNINNVGSNANLTINNLGSIPAVSINANDDDTVLNFSNAALAGTADDIAIDLAAMTTNSTVSLTRAAGATNKLETVSLSNNATANTLASLGTAGVAASKLEIDGSQNLTITGALAAGITNVDATSATGAVSVSSGNAAATLQGGSGNDTLDGSGSAKGVTIHGNAGDDNLTGGTGNDNIDGGAGKDTITMPGASLDKNDTIAGGEGADTLTNSTDGATIADAAFTNVTGVETFAGGAGNRLTSLTIDKLATAAGISTVLLQDTAAVDKLVIGATFTNDLTVDLDDDASANNVSANASYANVLTVNAKSSELNTTTNTIAGGKGTSDSLNISLVGDDTVTATSISGIETINITDGAALTKDTLTIALANGNVAAKKSLTIDASSLTASDDIDIDASNEADGSVIIKGGAGADDFIISQNANGGDNIEGGAGNDTIKVTAATLTKADTIAGGDGADSLVNNADTATIADAAFTNVTSVETVTSDGNKLFTSLTLDKLAHAAGVTTVTLTDTNGGNDVVNIGKGFAGDITVNLDDDANANKVAANAAYANSLTVKAKASLFDGDSANTVTGGAGSDTLNIIIDQTDTVGDFSAVTKVETISLTDGAATTTSNGLVTLDNANATYTSASAYETITVTAATLVKDSAIIDATAEADGKVVIVGGGAADTISISQSANFGDDIQGGAGNDTFKITQATLTKADTIAGGDGTDILMNNADTATIADAAFTNITSVETVTSNGNNLFTSLTLDKLAYAAGVNTVTLTDTDGGNDTVNIGKGFAGDLTVNLDDDANANKVAANASYAGALTVKADSSELDNSANTITGGKGTDTLHITLSDDDTANVSALTNVENIVAVNKSGDTTADTLTIALANASATYTNAIDYQTITVDASAFTNDILSIDASAEVDAAVVIKGGAAADAITVSKSANLGDNIDGGAGNDTITASNGNITILDTIAGGAGTDSITIADDSTINDVDLTNASGIEALASNNTALTATLAGQAAEAGISTITMSDHNKNDSITVGAAFGNDLSVTMTQGNDKIDASKNAGKLTVNVADLEDLDANDTIAGGSGTSDTINLTIDSDSQTATITNVSGIETIKVNDSATAGRDIIIVMGANNTQIAKGKTLTVNAADLTETNETLTFTGTTSETDGSLNITGGAGADTVTSGGGADTFTLGLGANVVNFTAVTASSGSTVDNFTDWTSGTDKMNFTLDYSGSGAGVTVNATKLTAAAGLSAAQASLSAERGQYIYDTENGQLYVNVNNDNLITSLDYKVTLPAAATAANTVVSGDVGFVITGSGQADTITTDGGADNVTGGAGNDTITTGAGVDTITGSAGADVINSGAGADALTIDGGGDDSAVDTIVLGANEIGTATAANGAVAVDTVANFTVGAGKDQIDISVTALEGLSGVTDLISAGKSDVSITAATSSVVTDGGTNATDLGGAATTTVIVAQAASDLNESTVETLLENGGGGALTFNVAAAVGDAFLAAVDNGTDTAIYAMVVGGNGIGNDETAAAGELTAIKLLTLTGIAAAEGLNAANFDFIA